MEPASRGLALTQGISENAASAAAAEQGTCQRAATDGAPDSAYGCPEDQRPLPS